MKHIFEFNEFGCPLSDSEIEELAYQTCGKLGPKMLSIFSKGVKSVTKNNLWSLNNDKNSGDIIMNLAKKNNIKIVGNGGPELSIFFNGVESMVKYLNNKGY